MSYVPPLSFISSVLYVLCYKVYRALRNVDDSHSLQDESAAYTSPSGRMWRKETLDVYDGSTIVVFRTIRLVCCVILACLQLQDTLDLYSNVTGFLMVSFYVSSCVNLLVPSLTEFLVRFTLRCSQSGRSSLHHSGETSTLNNYSYYCFLNLPPFSISTSGHCAQWTGTLTTFLSG